MPIAHRGRRQARALSSHTRPAMNAVFNHDVAALYVTEATQLPGRKLIIGRGSQVYVALYRYFPEIDMIFVLALRS
jgi:hypothetical protein